MFYYTLHIFLYIYMCIFYVYFYFLFISFGLCLAGGRDAGRFDEAQKAQLSFSFNFLLI